MSKNKKKAQPISTPKQSDTEYKEMQSVETNPSNVTRFDIESLTGITGTWRDVLCQCPWCESEEFVYLFEDHQTHYCASCNEEFSKEELEDYESENDGCIAPLDTSGVTPNPYLSEEIAEVKRASDAAYQRGIDAANDLNKQTKGNGVREFVPETASQIQQDINLTAGVTKGFEQRKSLKCYHAPQQVIAGKGWGVWAGTKAGCIETANKYDVIMNLTFSSIKECHSIPIPELKKWESYSSPFIELQMEWPDCGIIRLPRAFWEELVVYLETNHSKLLIFCQGGHGRTGTAIACLMVTALDYTAKQAIAWIRKNYCSSAIESVSQENYIRQIARKGRKQIEPESQAYTAETS
jgi:hypothetical protein